MRLMRWCSRRKERRLRVEGRLKEADYGWRTASNPSEAKGPSRTGQQALLEAKEWGYERWTIGLVWVALSLIAFTKKTTCAS